MISLYIETKMNHDEIEYPYIYKNQNTILTFKEYFNELITTGNFAGEYKIINTAIKFNINIIIYTNNNYNKNNKNFTFHYETFKSPQDILNPFIPILLIGWCISNHYILLLAKNNVLLNPNIIPVDPNNNIIEANNLITINNKKIKQHLRKLKNLEMTYLKNKIQIIIHIKNF